MALTTSTNSQALLDAQLDLWHTTFGYVKSMALKSALDLRIADAIHHHGGTATLAQIAARATLHPSKIPSLRRLMRVLTATGVFNAQHPDSNNGAAAELIYGLTPKSQLLVGSSSLAPFMAMMLHGIFVSPFLGLATWLQRDHSSDSSLFEMTHGQTAWELNDSNPAFGALFNEGMVRDSGFIMDIVVRECGGAVFEGLGSVVDVAGGLGGAAQSIARAFPHVACSVLDLPHVVAEAPGSADVKYIAGDMFKSIPLADAVFLKWVLHDWGDEDCVKILKNCKKAIPPREAGGKVIILDMVVGGEGSSNVKHKETQVLFDLFIMFVNGAERDEQEWRKIIFEAGFSDYKRESLCIYRMIFVVSVCRLASRPLAIMIRARCPPRDSRTCLIHSITYTSGASMRSCAGRCSCPELLLEALNILLAGIELACDAPHGAAI